MNTVNWNEIFNSFFNEEPKVSYYYKQLDRTNNQENLEINYTKDGAYLLVEVPGFNKSNLKIEMDDNFLVIDGKRTYKINGEEKTKNFYQKLSIGSGYKSESIEATMEDGILTIYIPNYKKQEKRKINIV